MPFDRSWRIDFLSFSLVALLCSAAADSSLNRSLVLLSWESNSNVRVYLSSIATPSTAGNLQPTVPIISASNVLSSKTTAKAVELSATSASVINKLKMNETQLDGNSWETTDRVLILCINELRLFTAVRTAPNFLSNSMKRPTKKS